MTAYTLFITFSGVYQFTRLPFGPKRAPSYFREIMATVVLTGLIYMICEMYIDDCVINRGITLTWRSPEVEPLFITW